VEAVYLDNAATSFPKPEAVHRAVSRFMRGNGASPGRGLYARALAAEEIIAGTRRALATLIGVDDPSRVIFTGGATEAVNLAILGLVRKGDHVVTTSLEHNAVWRCLRALERDGIIGLTAVQCLPDGSLPMGEMERSLRPPTRLIAMLHASNVTGTLLPIAEVGRLARSRGITFLVDAAQTAGVHSVDVPTAHIDLLALSGHKGLMGPQGTGALYVGAGVDLRPLKHGGTGRYSLQDDMPTHLPDRLEAGTPNVPGIAGLDAGLAHVLGRGVRAIRERETVLTGKAIALLAEIPGLTLYGPRDPERQVGVVSFNLDGFGPEQIAYALDEGYGIMVRAGLHCSPCAHRTIGTLERGTVRIGLGHATTENDLERLAVALRELARAG
jgi:cysteine desulfurase family protein